MTAASKPVVLVVLDGFGVSSQRRGNAAAQAETPTLDLLAAKFPFTTLQASGIAVGLPWGEAGNSEVGHLTMGAGRVLWHHLPRVVMAIQDGSFFSNPALASTIEQVRSRGSALHLLGLVSSGSVHSYAEHLYGFIELAKRSGLPKVWLHAITDGKDAPPTEAAGFLEGLSARLSGSPVAIASVLGRFWAMDRDHRWDRVRSAYQLLTEGKGTPFRDPVAYVRDAYAAGSSDEFIPPGYLAGEDGPALGRIGPGDGLIMMNFREDSVREIAEAFAAPPFDAFPRRRVPNLAMTTLTQYEKGLDGVAVAFPPIDITHPLGRVVSEAGLRQLRIAESEKYAHVTYFFNCGREEPFDGEDRILVPSLEVAHHDERPEMRAPDIAERVAELAAQYDFILANFANADMVGHTGNYAAAVKAVEALDRAIARIMARVLGTDGTLLITGDHGNVEMKQHPITGEPLTEHTTNPVPFFLAGRALELPAPRSKAEITARIRAIGGILTDIAPTVLELMGLARPAEMTGKSLFAPLAHEGEGSKAG